MENFEDNPEYIEKVLQLPCPSCGGELSYSASKNILLCKHCGHQKDIDQSNDLIVEQSLSKATAEKSQFTPKSIQKKVIDCTGCGAQLMINDKEISLRCNFCGSSKVNESATQKNMIQPQGIIPFKVDKNESTQKFKVWIQKGWFHPNKLKKLAQLGDLHGIYVPFWTYDAKTHANWSGEAGYYYYETEYYNDADGNTKSRQVQRTRWEYRSGSFNHFFDDILIVASKGLPHKLIQPIFPFQLEELINFNNELLVGWEAEIYSLDIIEGYRIADQKMDDALRDMASNHLGGDTQRSLRVNAQKWDQTYKHVLLPTWLCTYQYAGKSYQFAVNGQTGKIAGKKPISVIKVTLFVLFLISIALAIYYYAEYV